MFKGKTSGAQSITTGTETPIALAVEEFKQGVTHSKLTNNDQVTIATAGFLPDYGSSQLGSMADALLVYCGYSINGALVALNADPGLVGKFLIADCLRYSRPRR